MIKEQERVILVANARGNGAAQFHARALNGDLWFDNFGDRSKAVHACIDEVWTVGIT
jgi:hypothetical protein